MITRIPCTIRPRIFLIFLILGEAYFKQMKDGTILTVPYDFIHVTPPQRPISVLREAGDDLTVGGFVAVNKV